MNDNATTKIIIALFISTAAASVWLGYGLANSTIRKNAIEQSCGYFDMKTGEFKWGRPQ